MSFQNLPNNPTWAAKIGSYTDLLGQKLVDNEFLPNITAFLSIKMKSQDILSNCTSPKQPPDSFIKTGMVLGYVQSGKTNSMMTTTALASDNGYALVILLAGTTNDLLGQNRDRFCSTFNDVNNDLGKMAFEVHDYVLSLDNTDNLRSIAQNIGKHIKKWTKWGKKETLHVVPIMKNYANLRAFLEQLQIEVNKYTISSKDLEEYPILILDDEGDSYSPNNQGLMQAPSATHSWICDTVDNFPHCSYVQYTATGQALWLMHPGQRLSPNFTIVLDPGIGYIGGKEYFAAGGLHRNKIILIDETEVATYSKKTNDPKLPYPVLPAEALYQGLSVFLVGVLYELEEGTLEKNPFRSFLAHPYHETANHDQFGEWTHEILSDWFATVQKGNISQHNCQHYLDYAYDELINTTTISKHVLKDLLSNHLSTFRARLGFSVANTANTVFPFKNIDLNYNELKKTDIRYVIVCGGNKMGRGFTLAGLSVTVIHREAKNFSTSQEDTLQQRARFFGYKEKYIDTCRVFVSENSSDWFQSYSETEEYMRRYFSQLHSKDLRSIKQRIWAYSGIRATALSKLKGMKTHVRTSFFFGNKRGEIHQKTTPGMKAIRDNNARELRNFARNHLFSEGQIGFLPVRNKKGNPYSGADVNKAYSGEVDINYVVSMLEAQSYPPSADMSMIRDIIFELQRLKFEGVNKIKCFTNTLDGLKSREIKTLYKDNEDISNITNLANMGYLSRYTERQYNNPYLLIQLFQIDDEKSKESWHNHICFKFKVSGYTFLHYST